MKNLIWKKVNGPITFRVGEMSADPESRKFRYENYEIDADELFCSLPKEGGDGSWREFTWKDIKRIVSIADDLLPGHDTEHLASEFQTEESYYQEVLKRFKEVQNG